MTEGELLRRCDDRTAEVAVVGQGHVGLVLAMRASEEGFPVVGLETDRRRLALLEAGRSPVDDVPDPVLRAALRRGYRPSGHPGAIAGFDVAVVAVPTPLLDGAPDLSHVEAAGRVVGRALRPGALVVLESTTYPGTTEELVAPLLERASGGLRAGRDFLLGYSPERIDPGNPTFGLANTPKVFAGVDAASARAMEAFYGCLVDKLVPVATPAEAELAKLVENTFRQVNVALVNELAMLAADLGLDLWAAIEAAATKPFGFLPFRPGPGVGGHCLPVDPGYLAWRVRDGLGRPFRFAELADHVNREMPAYVVRRVRARLERDGVALDGALVLVLGLAYKPGTGDAREAPSLAVIERLLEGGARVAVADPRVGEVGLDPRVRRVRLGAAVLREADLVLLVTDHAEFDYDLVVRQARRVFDTRDRLRPYAAPHVERL